MAIARDTTAANIKPLEGAIVRRFYAGSTIAAGELIHLASDGQCDPCDAATITLAGVTGVALTGAVAGDRIDVVVLGPVVCLTGATIGALVYATDTAGEPGETAGTRSASPGSMNQPRCCSCDHSKRCSLG